MQGSLYSTFTFILLAIIITFCIGGQLAAAGRAEGGFLLVDKVFDERSVVVGHPFPVEIRIYNSGKGSAHRVMLLESSFAPENYTFLSGDLDKIFQEVAPGENVTINFTLQPLHSGPIEDKPALVSYTPASYIDTPQRAFSTSKRHIYILTEDQYHLYVADHSTQWSIVGLLAGFLILAPFARYYFTQKRALSTKLF
jgi:hypothetical protein